mgnify:CR=1 FL=1
MRYSVYREAFFSAAHHLRNYNGKCENIHGHNWRVRVYASSDSLDKDGFVLDFKVMDKIINNVIERLDHMDINCITPFDVKNPTAENIAEHIFNESQKEVKKIRENLYISGVHVWESDKSCAIVEP